MYPKIVSVGDVSQAITESVVATSSEYREEVEVKPQLQYDDPTNIVSFVNGDFVIIKEKKARLENFINKAILTRKYSIPIYEEPANQQFTKEYGYPFDRITKNKVVTGPITLYAEQEMVVALTRHPEINSIVDFVLEKDNNVLNMSFVALTNENQVLLIEEEYDVN